jgi:cytochrome c5
VQRAVVLMANRSGGSLKEPPAPPAAQTAGTGSVPAGSVGVTTATAGAMTPQAAAPSSPAPGAPKSPTPGAAPGGATTVAAAPAAAAGKADGKKVYETTCNVCHGAGIAGAPKFGDKAAWAPRLAQGVNVLHQHALQGFQGKAGLMPPKGGNTALADADVAAAVDYMAAAAK